MFDIIDRVILQKKQKRISKKLKTLVEKKNNNWKQYRAEEYHEMVQRKEKELLKKDVFLDWCKVNQSLLWKLIIDTYSSEKEDLAHLYLQLLRFLPRGRRNRINSKLKFFNEFLEDKFNL